MLKRPSPPPTPAGRARRTEFADHDFHEEVTVSLAPGELVHAAVAPVWSTAACAISFDGARYLLRGEGGEAAATFTTPVPSQMRVLDPKGTGPYVGRHTPMFWDSSITLEPATPAAGFDALRVVGTGAVWLALPGYILGISWPDEGGIVVDPAHVGMVEAQVAISGVTGPDGRRRLHLDGRAGVLLHSAPAR